MYFVSYNSIVHLFILSIQFLFRCTLYLGGWSVPQLAQRNIPDRSDYNMDKHIHTCGHFTVSSSPGLHVCRLWKKAEAPKGNPQEYRESIQTQYNSFHRQRFATQNLSAVNQRCQQLRHLCCHLFILYCHPLQLNHLANYHSFLQDHKLFQVTHMLKRSAAWVFEWLRINKTWRMFPNQGDSRFIENERTRTAFVLGANV